MGNGMLFANVCCHGATTSTLFLVIYFCWMFGMALMRNCSGTRCEGCMEVVHATKATTQQHSYCAGTEVYRIAMG